MKAMTTNTYLITGASDGIGKAIAMRLAPTGSIVIMHGRNSAKLQEAAEEVRRSSANPQIHTVLANFASLRQVASLADHIRDNFGWLNVLINNAGHLTDHWQASHDGYELTFAVNHLAPFLLTNRLLDTLKSNAPARVVTVASTAMGGGRLDFSDLELRHRFDGWQAYANSKLANVLFSRSLADRLAGSGVVCNSLCPGLIATNFMNTNSVFSPQARARMQPMMRPAEQGADVAVYAATAEPAAEISGAFFVRGPGDAGRPLTLDLDMEIAERLWSISCDYVAKWL